MHPSGSPLSPILGVPRGYLSGSSCPRTGLGPGRKSAAISVGWSQHNTATEDVQALGHAPGGAGFAAAWPRPHDGCGKVTLDLHNIYDRSEEIERALRPIIKQTVAKKALIDKIIPGKGFGQRPCCAAACEGRARSRAVDRVPSGPG